MSHEQFLVLHTGIYLCFVPGNCFLVRRTFPGLHTDISLWFVPGNCFLVTRTIHGFTHWNLSLVRFWELFSCQTNNSRFTRWNSGAASSDGGCLTSQQHTSVSQGRMYSDKYTCCHAEIEVADQTFYLTQPHYTDSCPLSPCTDPVKSGAWLGNTVAVIFRSLVWEPL